MENQIEITEIDQEIIDFRATVARDIKLKKQEFAAFREESLKREKELYEANKIAIKQEIESFDNLDILQTIAVWGSKQLLKENIDLDNIKDVLNKISECVCAVASCLKTENEAEKNMLQTTLIEWVRKEKTNNDFKAKYR